MGNFEDDLRELIDKYSKENASNTPDYILAQYMHSCLKAFNTAVQQRETWYGRDGRPSSAKTEAVMQTHDGMVVLTKGGSLTPESIERMDDFAKKLGCAWNSRLKSSSSSSNVNMMPRRA